MGDILLQENIQIGKQVGLRISAALAYHLRNIRINIAADNYLLETDIVKETVSENITDGKTLWFLSF